MAEDLQYLIDRIQKEAVDKADNEATSLISAAKDKAATIIKAAEVEAQAKLEKADKEALAYAERSERTLEQAARDLIITVGKRIEKMLSDILALQVEKNLSEDTVKQMLLSLAAGYTSDVKVCLSEEDAKKLNSFILGEFQQKIAAGVTVESDSDIHYGFRIKMNEGKVSHEFTNEALGEALSAHLRPELAKVVNSAAQGK